MGIVTKKWGMKTLPGGALVALNGEAGIQADTLAPGLHLWLWPWQYAVERTPFTYIPPGKIGVIEARDGKALPAGRVIARHVDVRLVPGRAGVHHGRRRARSADGDHRARHLPHQPAPVLGAAGRRRRHPGQQGRHRHHPRGPAARRRRDRRARSSTATTCSRTRRPSSTAGGSKGLQEQVLLAGRYFINPRFATVEIVDMTDVPIAHVGVVIAYVGEEGKDVTGEAVQARQPGRAGREGRLGRSARSRASIRSIRTRTRSTNVPTANVVLNWATGKTEAHQLDANLSTITVRSADGFKLQPRRRRRSSTFRATMRPRSSRASATCRRW